MGGEGSVYPHFLMMVVLLFSVYCFVDCHLPIFVWPLWFPSLNYVVQLPPWYLKTFLVKFFVKAKDNRKLCTL